MEGDMWLKFFKESIRKLDDVHINCSDTKWTEYMGIVMDDVGKK